MSVFVEKWQSKERFIEAIKAEWREGITKLLEFIDPKKAEKYINLLIERMEEEEVLE